MDVKMDSGGKAEAATAAAATATQPLPRNTSSAPPPLVVNDTSDKRPGPFFGKLFDRSNKTKRKGGGGEKSDCGSPLVAAVATDNLISSLTPAEAKDMTTKIE
jgi:hypothetical protein